ncbi:endonuclease/exonuclease/phosphatase family protein [Microvirga roseola]|uniref:endonuclease/exonuclease/phosphatase family protein n=1 Tax=Microvirga roseola TaxID=2883126 RepID=UPI001E5ECC9B|nr:endonuclease/exonuclease/phosphatase family protein [Microvirga roseola]
MPKKHAGTGRSGTRPVRKAIKALPAVLAALLLVATTGSFLGAWSWRLDLLTHFRPQLAAFGLIAVFVALLARSWAALAVSLVLTVVNAMPLAPYMAGDRAAAVGGVGPSDRIRVMTFNLHGESTDPESLRRLIERENPDVVLLTEVPDDAERSIPDDGRYPHRILDRRGSPLDVLLFSRWKPRDWSVDRSVASFLPVLTVELCHPETETKCFTLVGLHAARPFGEAGVRRQRAQLGAVAREVKAASGGAVIVVGDLNLTPWAPLFQSFTEQAGLEDSAKARGLAATWLNRFPLFGLPIDHILVNSGFEVIANQVGEDIGSDHLPVLADLSLKPEQG